MKTIYSFNSTILDYIFPNRKIRRALIQSGFAETKNLGEAKIEIIKFKIKKDHVLFSVFNKKLSTHDFYSKKSYLDELFKLNFIAFERVSIDKIKAYYARYDLKYKVDKWETCVGFNGLEKISISDLMNSYYIYGKSGSGKSTLLKSLLKQYIRISFIPKILILTGKPSDFSEFQRRAKIFSYSVEDLILFDQELKELELKRQEAEKNQEFIKERYIIIADEFHFLENEPEIQKSLYNLIRTGRSQKITIFLCSQSGLSSQFKHLNINMVSTKICVGRPESLALAHSLFGQNADSIFFNRIPQGYGYVSNDNVSGELVRFYYE